MSTMNITIDAQTVEQLAYYSQLLHKDATTMVHEALEFYFVEEEKKLSEQDPMTNLSFNEFWDDIEV